MFQVRFSFFLSLLIVGSSFCQEYDTIKKSRSQTTFGVIKKSFSTVPQDFKQMGLELSKNWKKTSLFVGGVASLVLVDKYTTEFYQDKIESKVVYSLPNISPKIINSNGTDVWPFQKNDVYIVYPIVGLYGFSLVSNNEKGQLVSANCVKALSYSYLITQLTLKSLIGRLRPDPSLSDGIVSDPFTNSPFKFGNFHRPFFKGNQYGTAMPSFHTTAYTAVAQVLAMEFNNYWIPYSVISFIFFSDIKGHRHWISDMVAGSLVGAVIGTAIVKSSRKYN